MNLVKSILIGLIIGGAFGAKVGAYLATIMDISSNWSSIELGFIFGALCGSITSLTVVIAKAEMFQNQRSDHEVRQIATESI